MVAVTWLFIFPNRPLEISLTLSLANITGLIMFLTVAMENPFLGRYAVSAGSFELIRNQLMKPQARGASRVRYFAGFA